jgi:hypothetical protein
VTLQFDKEAWRETGVTNERAMLIVTDKLERECSESKCIWEMRDCIEGAKFVTYYFPDVRQASLPSGSVVWLSVCREFLTVRSRNNDDSADSDN